MFVYFFARMALTPARCESILDNASIVVTCKIMLLELF